MAKKIEFIFTETESIHNNPENTMPNGVKTLAELRATLHIHPWDPIPAEALEAFETAIKLEFLARQNKERVIREWRRRLAKRSDTPKKKRRISFGNAVFHGHKQNKSDQVELHDRLGREVLSTPAIEGNNGLQAVLTWCQDWSALAVGDPTLVNSFLATKGLTRAQFIKDLRNMERAFANKVPYIIGYKTSFKIKPYYAEMELILSDGFLPAHWAPTGKMIYLLPRLRLYLIKVLRDQTTASSSIQRIWRGYRARHPPIAAAAAAPPIPPPPAKKLNDFKFMNRVVKERSGNKVYN